MKVLVQVRYQRALKYIDVYNNAWLGKLAPKYLNIRYLEKTFNCWKIEK